MIERLIHQIWLGPHHMPKREVGFVRQMKAMHPGFDHLMWSDGNLPPMSENVRECYDWRMARKDYAFAADILRCVVVHLHGGIYFDVDVEPRLGLAGMDLDTISGWFHHQFAGDYALSNDCFALAKGFPLGGLLLSKFRHPEYDFGPHWMGDCLRTYCGLSRDHDHATVRARARSLGILYMPSAVCQPGGKENEVWETRFYHHALYSWHPDNAKKIAEGF